MFIKIIIGDKYMKIGIIGVGNMGSALVKALKNKGYNEIYGSNIIDLDKLKALGINATTDNNEVIGNSDYIIICVKPQILTSVAKEMKIDNKLYISMAAGITLSKLYEILGTKRVARVMPNIGLQYGDSVTAYVMGEECNESDEKALIEIFNTAGVSIKSTEEQMIGFTYAGCAPGLIARSIEPDVQTMIDQHMTRDQIIKAQASSLRTVARLLEQGKTHEEIYKMVASPKGITEAAYLKNLELGTYENIKKGGVAALLRNDELAK
jgi:pyrroline-5-carboxylate reductase